VGKEKNNIYPYSVFFLRTVVLPYLLLATGLFLTVFLTIYYSISAMDQLTGYIASFLLFIVYRFVTKLRWVKISEGNYFYVRSDVFQTEKNKTEPSVYEKEYSWSKKHYRTYFICAAASVLLGLLLWGGKDIVLPVVILLIGAYLFLNGIQELRKKPLIKIASTGVWTAQSGFREWSDVKRIEKTTPFTDKQRVSVEIYFTSPVPSEFPELKIVLGDFKHHEELTEIINKYKGF
jgi:hypothetical protein